MSKSNAMTSEQKGSHGLIIGRPRPGDAIGGALRNAFDRDLAALPSDMRRLLGALDAPRGRA